METKLNLVQLSPEVAAAVQQVAQFEATYCMLTSQVANFLKSNHNLFGELSNDPEEILDELFIGNDNLTLTLEKITSGIIYCDHLRVEL